MRRRRGSQQVSLFAFQDIITGVAGVMLFILLLLVVQLTLKTIEKQAEQTNPHEESSLTISATVPTASPAVAITAGDLEAAKERLSEMQIDAAGLLDAQGGEVERRIAEAQDALEELMQQSAAIRDDASKMQSDVENKKESSERQKTIARRNELRERRKRLKKDRKMYEGGKLVAFRAPKSGVRNLWMVDLRASHATLFDVQAPWQPGGQGAAVEAKYPVGESPFAIVAAVKRELTKHSKTRQIVVVLRPSVAGRGDALLQAFRSSGYQVALELLDEDTQIARPSRNDSPHDSSGAG